MESTIKIVYHSWKSCLSSNHINSISTRLHWKVAWKPRIQTKTTGSTSKVNTKYPRKAPKSYKPVKSYHMSSQKTKQMTLQGSLVLDHQTCQEVDLKYNWRIYPKIVVWKMQLSMLMPILVPSISGISQSVTLRDRRIMTMWCLCWTNSNLRSAIGRKWTSQIRSSLECSAATSWKAIISLMVHYQ